MIPKVTKGSRPFGLMRYLVGPGRHNEHTEPHLVNGSPTIMAWHDDAELSRDSADAIARELDLNRKAFGFDTDEAMTWQCSLSLSYEEGEQGDQRWAEIAQEFADRMGFTEASGKAPCQWVAIHHGQSTKGNDHIHFIASRVREDGTKWSDFRDYKAAQKVARELEREYGYRELGGEASSQRWLSRPEHERQAQENGRTAARFRLGDTVRSCAVSASSEGQFVRSMRRAGLLVRPRFAEGQASVVVGYSVAERPPKGKQPLWFGGGKLSKDLTLTALRQRWPDTPMGAQEAADEWTAAKRHKRLAHSDLDPVIRDPQMGKQMADELARAHSALRDVDPTDRQTWAHVARETSGVFAAWSQATEHEDGPLARTSRALARSANRAGEPIREPIDPPLRMGGAALYLMAMQRAAPHMAQAMLMRQMIRLAGSLHNMHKANQEHTEAAAINDRIRGDLAAVAAPLPEVPQQGRTEAVAHGGPTRQVRPLRETTGPDRAHATAQHGPEQETTKGVER